MEAFYTILSVPEESLIFEAVTCLCGGVVFTAIPTFIACFVGGTVHVPFWALIAEVIILILEILGADTLTLV